MAQGELHAHSANPYGHSKRMVEQLILDWGAANRAVRAVAGINLRYFTLWACVALR